MYIFFLYVMLIPFIYYSWWIAIFFSKILQFHLTVLTQIWQKLISQSCWYHCISWKAHFFFWNFATSTDTPGADLAKDDLAKLFVPFIYFSLGWISWIAEFFSAIFQFHLTVLTQIWQKLISLSCWYHCISWKAHFFFEILQLQLTALTLIWQKLIWQSCLYHLCISH